MKAFAFSLEAVLIVRAREEQAAAEAWARAVREQTRAGQTLEAAKQALDAAQTALGQTRRERIRPGDQTLYLHAIANQQAACGQLADALRAAAQVTQARHTALLQARMKREVLARLKQKKMKEYQSAIQAMEEAAVDDLIIVRYGTRRAGR
ncbi:MAG: flagellar FliJ family protein [Chthoniobacteraceae bacterium]|nr:flagellar FliJ family protein [Chthoniobacteraceae bacterium]